MAQRILAWIWPDITAYVTNNDTTAAVSSVKIENNCDDTALFTYDLYGEEYNVLVYGRTKVSMTIGATAESDVRQFGLSMYAYPSYIRVTRAALTTPPAPPSIRLLSASLSTPVVS